MRACRVVPPANLHIQLHIFYQRRFAIKRAFQQKQVFYLRHWMECGSITAVRVTLPLVIGCWVTGQEYCANQKKFRSLFMTFDWTLKCYYEQKIWDDPFFQLNSLGSNLRNSFWHFEGGKNFIAASILNVNSRPWVANICAKSFYRMWIINECLKCNWISTPIFVNFLSHG